MIAYDIKCSKGHIFEGWFESIEAYEIQEKQGLIACPVCGSTEVNRTPSTFGIARHREQRPAEYPNPQQLFKEFIENNFEDVGTDFAKEALKMHYGVNENRNIRGVSTKQEEEMLQDEGIQFFKLSDIYKPFQEDDD